jgi:sigma-B regulation protein RsbU (phosphoserine phosphatase)
VTTLQTAGIVLGVVETFAFEQKSLCLNEGDGILFYTDGVTEAFNDDDEMFGEERLLESIEAHWHLSGPDLVDKIYQIVSAFVHPEPQSDDFTLLLLRKRPDSE